MLPKNKESALQNTVNKIANWSKETKFQLNPSKCKELRKNFTKQPRNDELEKIDGQCFETVKSVKVLGLTITDDLKWNSQVENIVQKTSKRLY